MKRLFTLREWGGLLTLVMVWMCSVVVSAQTTVTKSSFTEVSGSLDEVVSYTTAKGGGTAAPAIYSNEIRLYQNSNGTGGGTITLKTTDGYKLNSVAIGSSMATKIAYTLDSETTKSATVSLSKGGVYSVSDLEAQSITFYCMGTSSSSRLYVNSLSATYSSTVVSSVDSPDFSIPSGTYYEIQNVDITAEDGADIYYTTDDSKPTEETGTLYTGPVEISASTTLKAIAVKDGESSAVASATYSIIIPTGEVNAIVAQKNGVYYAMSSVLNNEKLMAEEVNVVNGKVINETWAKEIVWYVDETQGTIKSMNGQYVSHKSSTSIELSNTEFNWIYDTETGYWISTIDTDRYLAFQLDTPNMYFRAYKDLDNYPKAVVMTFADGYVRSTTVDKFGTICLPCAVAADDIAGAKFYSVAGKQTDGGVLKGIVLTEETALQAGVPYIFCATADKLVVAYNGGAAEATSANGLVGSLSGQDVAQGKHILTNNTVKECGTGCTIGANRAYFDIDAMSEFGGALGVNQRMITFDDTETDINEVGVSSQNIVDVYTISGVKVRSQVDASHATEALPQGIYVVNGKKVVVR